MSASRELDIEVAQKVFGIKKIYGRGGEPWDGAKHGRYDCYYIPSGKPWRTHHTDAAYLPMYSALMENAMLLVDRWHGDVDMRRQNEFWAVTFFEPSREYRAIEPTLPEAICRAALKASETKQASILGRFGSETTTDTPRAAEEG